MNFDCASTEIQMFNIGILAEPKRLIITSKIALLPNRRIKASISILKLTLAVR